MSYSNQNVKVSPDEIEKYCPGITAHVNDIYNNKDNTLTKKQICKQEIKSFCASADPHISVDNCGSLFNDNKDHQPDSMSAYCNCKKQFKNPDDIYNCCLQITNDQYDCQDDVQNNTPCGPVINGYQSYCDCRQEIAKNDPDVFKYGNDIISCCIEKSNSPTDCNLYVNSKRDCPGQSNPPNTPPSNPNTPPSDPNTPPSDPNTPPSDPNTPPSDPPSPSPSPSKPSSRKVGGSQNNILESLTVPEIIGFIMAIIVIGILIYFIIELSKKK